MLTLLESVDMSSVSAKGNKATNCEEMDQERTRADSSDAVCRLEGDALTSYITLSRVESVQLHCRAASPRGSLEVFQNAREFCHDLFFCLCLCVV